MAGQTGSSVELTWGLSTRWRDTGIGEDTSQTMLAPAAVVAIDTDEESRLHPIS